MLRTALRPRWLALLAVVLVAATGMSLLGQWQLDRARRADDAPPDVPVLLTEVLRPRTGFPAAAEGRLVVITGSWDGDRQLLVPQRELRGRAGYWVLTPLVLDARSAVPVVRGWVPSPSAPAAAAPSGAVEVVGRLYPTEPPLDRRPGTGTGLPAGQVARVAGPDLVAAWPYPLFTGYVSLEGEEPEPAGPVPTALPVREPPSGVHWQNLSYALQWWAFALFGLFFWWRLVRDDAARRAPDGVPPGSIREHGPVAPERTP